MKCKGCFELRTFPITYTLPHNVFILRTCTREMYLEPCQTFIMKPFQKQSSRGVLRKRCSENMQQTYGRTPMPKCDFSNFIEITLLHGRSLVKLLHIFRIPFSKNTSGWLLLPFAEIFNGFLSLTSFTKNFCYRWLTRF